MKSGVVDKQREVVYAIIELSSPEDSVMAQVTLEQVERLVDELRPIEQVHLLQYLTPRIARAVSQSQIAPPPLYEAWREFFRIGDTIANGDAPEGETLTQAVISMRR
jgi:hypothetical protein